MKKIISSVCLAAALAAATALAAAEDRVADQCGVCHEKATKEWLVSPHAQSINERFLAEWKREGERWECFVCHTSQYDRKNKTFSHAGVSCESCHGPVKEDHFDKDKKVKMVLPVTTEVCQNCHSVTFGEWRVSRHGQKNIRCYDCHKMHEMKQRKEDPDQMCGTCHTERLKDYSHATHHVKGVLCINCHMPEAPGAGLKIKGTGARGHSFGVGAETCANCHREMVHARSDRVVLEGEIARLKEITPEKLQQQVHDQQQELTQLRTALRANRRVFSVITIVAFVLGVMIEYTILHHYRKKSTADAAKP